MFRVAVALVLSFALSDAPAQGRPGPPLLQQSADLAVAVENAALQRQFELLSAMPEATVEYSALGTVFRVSGVAGIRLHMDDVRRLEVGSDATKALAPLAPLLLATGRETWIAREIWPEDRARMQIRADEYIRGIPVVHGRLAVGFDPQTGAVSSYSSGFLPDRELPAAPRLSAAESYANLVRAFEASGDAVAGSVQQIGEARLSYLGTVGRSDEGRPGLVWEWHISFRCPTGRGDNEQVLVDASDGMVVGRASTTSYSVSAGPCQEREEAPQECLAEPDPSLSAAAHNSSCDAGKPAKPRLIATRVDCNTFHLKWPRIPGAAQYHLIGAPSDLGWAFFHTLGSGNVHQCRARITEPTLVKMRPCDGCGCGEWSEVLTLAPGDSCQ